MPADKRLHLPGRSRRIRKLAESCREPDGPPARSATLDDIIDAQVNFTAQGVFASHGVGRCLDTSDRYIAIPHKNDLDLGTDLALRFAAEELPGLYDRVQQFFRHRGAYARFKELLASEGCLDKWYAFEAESTERALRDWCTEHDINLIGNEERPA